MRRILSCLLAITLALGHAPAHSESLLPEVLSPYSAPETVDEMRYQTSLPLYFQSLDGRNLFADPMTFTLPRGQMSARTILQALFMHPADQQTQSPGGETDLHLYGKMPVEVSSGICTVNLDSSALALDAQDLYTLSLCMAASLDGINGIHSINLLIADRAVGMDVADYLPCGSVTAHSGVELPVLWEQMRTRATPLGENPAEIPLSLNATLYFPLSDELGCMPEVRTLSFDGQTPAILAEGLISALSQGAHYLPLCDSADIASLLSGDVEVSELAGGGRLLTLHFQSELESRLSLMGVRPINLLASLVMTLTTLIPSVGAVRIFSGSTLMTSLYDDEFGMLTFEDGYQYRRQYQSFLRDTARFYVAKDRALTAITRSVPTGTTEDIPTLLRLLSEGVTDTERQTGLSATVPPGLNEEDVLGLAMQDDTLLVNLSPRSMRLFSAISGDQEMLLCYSLVTTFCEALHISRVRFFFDDAMPQTLGGNIFWGGVFYLNYSLINQNRG